MPGKREDEPVSIMLDRSSLRMSVSRICERECWTNLWRGRDDGDWVVLVSLDCRHSGNDSANSSSCNND
jgi:hypothetical protein